MRTAHVQLLNKGKRAVRGGSVCQTKTMSKTLRKSRDGEKSIKIAFLVSTSIVNCTVLYSMSNEE